MTADDDNLCPACDGSGGSGYPCECASCGGTGMAGSWTHDEPDDDDLYVSDWGDTDAEVRW